MPEIVEQAIANLKREGLLSPDALAKIPIEQLAEASGNPPEFRTAMAALFMPEPFKMEAADTDVKVRTEIKQTGGKGIPLDYYLEKTAAGWKVYDLEVAGASLVTNYRSTFAQEIRANGVDGLIRSLQAKNKHPEIPVKAK